MSKTIEFVEQNICECKKHIQYLNEQINEYKKYPSFVKDYKERIEELKPILQNLEQIKCELEAWFVVKPRIRFEEHSRAWIYLNKIYKDDPTYSVIEKNLQKNKRSIANVTKEGNEVTVDIVEFEDEQ